MTAYVDLNIFDQIEKLSKLEKPIKDYYQTLLNLITEKKITTAYSNAHLNDLFRGFKKNPNYIEGHLKNIQTLTANLCICQYWGEQNATIHYRNIFEFFHGKVSELECESESFLDLYYDDPLMESLLDLYKLMPLPSNFKEGYKDPMFGIMFPLSKNNPTFCSLQEDIFNFHSRMNSDYGLYKTFKNYLFTNLQKLRKDQKFAKAINPHLKDLPKHLELPDIFDYYTPKTKTSDNIMYSKILDTFFKYDLSGYKSDGFFNNMFDDALHTFYASHFDFFITNDDRCKYKAEKTFNKLRIQTKSLK